MMDLGIEYYLFLMSISLILVYDHLQKLTEVVYQLLIAYYVIDMGINGGSLKSSFCSRDSEIFTIQLELGVFPWLWKPIK